MQGCRAKRSRLNYDARSTEQLFDACTTFEADAPVTNAANGRRCRRRSSSSACIDPARHCWSRCSRGIRSVAALGELYDFTSAMRYTTDHHCKGVIDATLVEKAAQCRSGRGGQALPRRCQLALERLAILHRQAPFQLPEHRLHRTRALPQAKILHMVRDPVETCFSNLRELFSDANPYSYDLGELADYYSLYASLDEALARALSRPNTDVEYARLLTDPESQLRRVTEFCGLPLDPAMLELARTPPWRCHRQRGSGA